MKKAIYRLWVLPIFLFLAVFTAPDAGAISGSGTEADPYVISSTQDLAAMHQDLAGHYILDRDIDLTGYDHEPIGNEWEGPFTGSLDGRGYTISNLTMDLGGTKYVGLFGYLEGSVSDLRFSDVRILGGRYVGTVAGMATDTSSIVGCQVLSGEILVSSLIANDTCIGGIVGKTSGFLGQDLNCAMVNSYSNASRATYLGGIAGYFTTSEMYELCNLENRGTLRFSQYIGGLFGHANSFESINCSNSGNISDGSYTGGFAGSCTSANIKNCNNYGNITSSTCAGGFVGNCSSANITGCSNSGNIYASPSYGYNVTHYYTYAGGFVGSCTSVTMINCNNAGNVSAEHTFLYSSNHYTYSGGFVGYCSTASIIGCSNYSDITATLVSSPYYSSFCTAGGIIGYCDSSVITTECTNSGAIYSSGYAGGFVGYGSATFTDCTNSGNISGSNTGGFVGYGSSCTFTNCTNSGDVSGSTGGFVGYGSATFTTGNLNLGFTSSPALHITSTYISLGGRIANNSELRSNIYIEGIFCSELRGGTQNDLTFEEMKQIESYPDLDFGTVWSIDPNINSGLPTPNDIPVDYMDQSVLILAQGETETITPPFQADIWEVSDPDIVSCVNGKIIAKGVGSAVVKAKTNDGRQSNCVIFVYQVRQAEIEEALELKPNASATLTTNIPDYDPQAIHWSSSDTSIATVDAYGYVKAQNKAGTAMITAYLPLSDTSATCEVTVVGSPITGVYLNSDTTVNAGTPTKLTFSVYPAAYSGTLTWKSSDESVLTVESGIVTGHKAGSAVVTVISDTGYSDTCLVTVMQPCQTLTLDRSEVTLELGYTDQLMATMTPSDCTDSITWTSSNGNVVSVSNTGVLTPNRVGQAVITAKATSGVTATCTVTVKAASILPDSITLNQTILRPSVGEKVALTASLLPTNATDKTITWTSSNPDVATVTGTGVVEALSPGFAEIRATTVNGLYDVCQVTVAQVSSAGFVLTDNRIQTVKQADTEVHITKNPGIAAFSVDVTYDADLLTPVGITSGDLLASGTLTSNIETAAEEGYLTVTWYSAEDMTDDGLAFTITWEARDTVATTPLSLSYTDGDICNSEKIEVGFTVEDGQMEIIDYMIGDIYPDNLLNMKDIVYFARWFNGQEDMTDAQKKYANVYYDADLNVKDLTELAQLLNRSLTEVESTSLLRSILSLAEASPYEISVSDGEVDQNGDVRLTVTGADCPGVAAFRFQLIAPEGYDVVEVLPGSGLPQSDTFLYNEETGIVSWYQDSSAELNGTLFTIRLHTANVPQAGVVSLDYMDTDFFSAETFANVPVDVSAGNIRVAPSVTFGQPEIQNGLIHFDIQANNSIKATLIAAFYQDGGKLLTTQSYGITTVTGTKDYSVEPPAGWKTCKFFLLDEGTYIPLCGTVGLSKK